METVTVVNDSSTLFDRVKQWLGSSRDVLLIVEGDTLIVKRASVPQLEQIIRDDEKMPLETIVHEVNSFRRERV